ncbi:hypothetical protein A176_001098 [Myxococcus hansupus]|uniref:Zinc finger/thioredoxin putative domain-containing protein n=1 Tax=Pseudomyxococcus hansupus TaxID=1297742 RepID=A0A0H4WLD0_9BACT|nr:zinc-ribbon domain-containing protein [Myxococcus hansupus]AKQ64186.1 hypothetical protein A176_001098 [Myxococcus hansupus]
MIVKCERCQTRFKIPDEKVTEKGVKVRCTKCQNTFRVARDAAAVAPPEPPAPSTDGQADPFARFGVAADPRSVELTKPGYFEMGVEATRPLPERPSAPPSTWNSMDGDLGSDDSVFQEPTRVTRLPLPEAAPPPPPPGAFVVPVPGNSGRPPPSKAGAAGPVAPPRGPPMGLEDRAAPPVPESTPPGVSPASARRGAVPPAPPPPGADPFSDLLGEPAPARPEASASAGALRRGAVAPPQGGSPSGAVALGVMRPAGRQPSAATPAYGGDDPFASIDIDVAPVSSASPGAPPPVEDDPFASLDIDDAGSAAAPAASAHGASGPRGAAVSAPVPPLGADPFASIDLHGAPPAHAGAPTGDADPFASIDLHGTPAPKPARSSPPQASADPFASIDLHGAPGPKPARSSPPQASADPFASIDLHGTPAPKPARSSPPQASADPFASIDLHGAPPAKSAKGASPASSAKGAAPVAPPPAGPDPFAAIDVGAAPVAPPPAGPDPFAAIDVGAAGDAGASGAPSPFGVLDAAGGLSPDDGASASGHDATSNPGDLFDLGAHGEDSGMHPTDTGRAALFGTTAPGSEHLSGASLLADVPAMEGAQDFGVTLGRVGAPSGVQREVLDVDGLPTKPVVTVAKPTARPEDVGIPQRRPSSRFGKAVGFVVNFVLAAVVVAALGVAARMYQRDGRVDLSALSLESVRSLVVPTAKPLVAVDVTNGLYETRDGRALYYVRGEALNHSETAARIRVRAALYDGQQRVASSEALVGACPRPKNSIPPARSRRLRPCASASTRPRCPWRPGRRRPLSSCFRSTPRTWGASGWS